jgi:hypothetical protein
VFAGDSLAQGPQPLFLDAWQLSPPVACDSHLGHVAIFVHRFAVLVDLAVLKLNGTITYRAKDQSRIGRAQLSRGNFPCQLDRNLFEVRFLERRFEVPHDFFSLQ